MRAETFVLRSALVAARKKLRRLEDKKKGPKSLANLTGDRVMREISISVAYGGDLRFM